MHIAELAIIGLGLSMDAFAVAVGKGLGMKEGIAPRAAAVGLAFGAFQALMPFIGYFAGGFFTQIVEPFGYWIAAVVLAAIGAKMIVDALKGGDGGVPEQGQGVSAGNRIPLFELLALAVATSIDALAVGVGFAFVEVDIAVACAIIGIVTFAVSFGGVFLGSAFGSRWERPSTLAGGTVLIVIGIKMIVEHVFL